MKKKKLETKLAKTKKKLAKTKTELDAMLLIIEASGMPKDSEKPAVGVANGKDGISAIPTTANPTDKTAKS